MTHAASIRRAVACLFAAMLALPAVAQAASKPVLVRDAVAPAPDVTTASGCVLSPGNLTSTSFNWTPDWWTSLATLVRPSDCTTCTSSQGMLVDSVEVRLRWFGACSAQVQLSIVATDGNTSCPAPDTTRVLCGPVVFPVSSTGPGGVVYQLAPPAGWCVAQPAFVLMRFRGFDTCLPAITQGSDADHACYQYFTTRTMQPTFTDWNDGGNGPLWVKVVGECCTVAGVADTPRGLALGVVNPARGSATVFWSLPATGEARLAIYDVTGRRVRELAHGSLSAGIHSTRWDGRDDAGRLVNPGLYLVKLEAAGRVLSHQVALIR